MYTVLCERESSCEKVAIRWDSNHKSLNLLLVDKTSDISYQTDVAPKKWRDAFDHPFVYVSNA